MNSSLNETDSVANDSKIIIVTEGLSSQFYISLFLLYIPGIVTNIISLIVIVYEARHTGRPTNFLLFILCLTDLVAVATTAFWHNMGRFGVIQTYSVCAVKTFMQIFCPIFSGAISVLLALDRALAFCAPFFYRSNITKKVWSAACFGASMIVSCLCVLPHLGLGSLWNPMYKGNTVRYSCTAFRYQEELKKKTFLIVLSTIGLLIIFSIITCNAVVVREVLKLRKRQADVKKSSGSLMQSKATELRFAIIVVVLACVFLTCWVPYNVWIIYSLVGANMPLVIRGKIHMLAGFNFTIDPFVYLIIRKSNRQMLRRLFFCKKCTTWKREADFSTVASENSISNSLQTWATNTNS